MCVCATLQNPTILARKPNKGRRRFSSAEAFDEADPPEPAEDPIGSGLVTYLHNLSFSPADFPAELQSCCA